MKKNIATIALLALCCASCGFRHDVKVATRQYEKDRMPIAAAVSDSVATISDNQLVNQGRYTQLKVHGAIAVCMSPDCTEATIKADPRDLNRVGFVATGTELKINYKGHRTGTCRPITVTLPECTKLCEVELDEASYFEGRLWGSCSISASEASKAVVNLAEDVYSVRVESGEASKVIVRGEAVEVNVEVEDASHANLSGLKTQRAYIDIEDSGCSKINASVGIWGRMEDASHLMYIGNPELNIESDPNCRIEQIKEEEQQHNNQ